MVAQDSDGTNGQRTVRSLIDFALGQKEKWLCIAVGLALLGFAAFQLFDGAAQVPVVMFGVVGAALLMIGLGRNPSVGGITVEHGGTKISVAGALDERKVASTGAEAKPKALEEPRTEAEQAIVEKGSASDEVEVEKTDPFSEAIDAWISKDHDQFDVKMREAISAAQDEGHMVMLSAMRLGWLHGVGTSGKLEELEDLRTKYPSSPEPIMRLGDIYSSAGENERAVALFAEGLGVPGL